MALAFFLILPLEGKAATTSYPAYRLAPNDTLRAHFVHRHYSETNQLLVKTEGRLLLEKKEGALWIVEKPFPVIFVMTPEGSAQLLGSIPVLKQSAETHPFFAEIPSLVEAALNGETQRLQPHFGIKKKNGSFWSVTLTPHEGDASAPLFKSLTAKGRRHIETATIQLPSGGYDEIAFSEESLGKDDLTAGEKAALEAAKQAP